MKKINGEYNAEFGLTRVFFFTLASILCVFLLCACKEKTTVDTADYNTISFPNYTEENPVRYLQENEFGKYDGWQDFGKNYRYICILLQNFV